ncbi:MAG: TIGR00730 family Rossman fold protein [Candidatus Hydrogenedentes bacterium]|nr:TIGR00730 family Rossman fold protein [Candidatus Hydrogenedentota bacterium]
MKSTKNHEGKWPEKAYKNLAFLNSPDARTIRVLCEFIEPGTRFRRNRIHDTVVFFGSARISPRDEALRELESVRAACSAAKRPSQAQRDAVLCAERAVEMARYYEDAADLAERMTRWSRRLGGGKRRFVVCSGGGPGIMEAANRGASRAGGPTIGLNISLPFEQMPNPYQSQELAFEFHYFFVRKFWFAYLAKALVVFPGGFGTMDEMFEILTLIQTRKTAKPMPVVLYGSAYWNEIVNFDALVKWGMIDRKDLELFRVVDDVDTAFTYLTAELKRLHI